MSTDPGRKNRRGHPRVHAPKGMVVAWRSGSVQDVSRLGTMALGGLFLHTPNPPSNGSMLELLFDTATGSPVRARAVVRNSMPGKGMGVKFVHMQAEDRSRLNKFLKTQIEAGNIQEDFPAEKPHAPVSENGAQQGATLASGVEDQPAGDPVISPPQEEAAAKDGHAEESTLGPERNPLQEKVKGHQDDAVGEEEFRHYLALSEKSNHYQLLGVPSDAAFRDIKQSFYGLARKFHPDRHMQRPEWTTALQQLMGALTEAYDVLSDEAKRGLYDRKLIHRQTETEETLEGCLKLSATALRDGNREGAIFWMRKCVNIAPEVAKYRVSLAASLAMLPHHRREAVEHFQKAMELDRWNTDAYLQCAELYEQWQLPWRAAPLYSKVLEFDPGNLAGRAGLARCASKEKKKKDAPRLARLFSRK